MTTCFFVKVTLENLQKIKLEESLASPSSLGPESCPLPCLRNAQGHPGNWLTGIHTARPVASEPQAPTPQWDSLRITIQSLLPGTKEEVNCTSCSPAQLTSSSTTASAREVGSAPCPLHTLPCPLPIHLHGRESSSPPHHGASDDAGGLCMGGEGDLFPLTPLHVGRKNPILNPTSTQRPGQAAALSAPLVLVLVSGETLNCFTSSFVEHSEHQLWSYSLKIAFFIIE